MLAADLSTDEGWEPVAARLADPGRPVDLLVNNAGHEPQHAVPALDAREETQLLRLNVHAVMRLTLAALPGMVERRPRRCRQCLLGGRFRRGDARLDLPGVEGVGDELQRVGGAVGGPVRGTGDGAVPRVRAHRVPPAAGINMSKTPDWLWLDADALVRDALRDLRRGKVVSVPNWKYKVAAFGLRHLPRRLLQRVARDTRGASAATNPPLMRRIEPLRPRADPARSASSIARPRAGRASSACRLDSRGMWWSEIG